MESLMHPLVIVLGILIALRIVRLRTALLLVLGLALFPYLAGVALNTASDLFQFARAHLPPWVVVLAIGVGTLMLLRVVLRILFGPATADHAVGALIATAFTAVFRLLLRPLRYLRQL